VTATALLAELEAAGVRLSLAGDDLRFQTRPGVSIAPYRERIAASKPALLAELLKARIIAAVNVEPADFDRAEYDRLWALYRVHAGVGNALLREEEIAALGLDPSLHWMHVSKEPVAASVPPDDWDGTIPAGCGVQSVCCVLGPCPHVTWHGHCWAEGHRS
jgi:hypothetical protein